MRVLHVAEVLKGGTSSYIDEVLLFQKMELGQDDIAIYVPTSQKDFLLNRAGTSLFEFDDTGSRIKKTWQLFRSIREITNQARVDILHIHGTIAGVACRLAFLFALTKPKIVYCAHGWSFDRKRNAQENSVLGFVERLLSYACDKIICISKHDFRSGQRVGIAPSRMVTIENGIGPLPPSRKVAIPRWPENRLRVLFAGRFDQQKGIDVFMWAMAPLAERCFGIAIGDSSVGDASLPRIPTNVHLAGWLPRDEVQDYLKTCDVLVMPSRWEGFGLSALEAMRAGVAVFASDVGGLPELVQHDLNGKLFAVDDVQGLSTALKNLTQEEARRMGNAGAARFEALFTAETMNRKILALYQQLVPNK